MRKKIIKRTVKTRLSCRSGQTSVSVFALIFLLIGAIGSSVYFYIEMEKDAQMYADKTEALNGKVIKLSENLKTVEVENVKLRSSVETYKQQADEFKKKYEETAKINEALTEIQATLDGEFQRMQEVLTTGFGNMDDFSRIFNSRMEGFFGANKKELAKLAERGKRFRSSDKGEVELPEIVVNANEEKSEERSVTVKRAEPAPPAKTADQAAAAVPKALTDKQRENQEIRKKYDRQVKVMKVNQKHKFFVINKGLIDGIKVGKPVDVYRQDMKIGNALITEVRELISLAEIKEQVNGYFIENGDMVRL